MYLTILALTLKHKERDRAGFFIKRVKCKAASLLALSLSLSVSPCSECYQQLDYSLVGLGRHLVQEELGRCFADCAAVDSEGTVAPGRSPEPPSQDSADRLSSEERTGRLRWRPATGPRTWVQSTVSVGCQGRCLGGHAGSRATSPLGLLCSALLQLGCPLYGRPAPRGTPACCRTTPWPSGSAERSRHFLDTVLCYG